MKGAHGPAMRIALAEIDEGRSHHAILHASGLEVVLVATKVVAPQKSPSRKHCCNVGWKHSRVESGHLFWPANERVQLVDLRRLRIASDDIVGSRVARAEALVHMVELSAKDATLGMLQNR